MSTSIVAILSSSDIGMVVTLFALTRLGYTVMLLSPRLSADACISLLHVVGCNTILHGQTATINATIQGIQNLKSESESESGTNISCHPVLSGTYLCIEAPPSDVDSSCTDKGKISTTTTTTTADQCRTVMGIDQTNRDPQKTVIIMHSSGSTGRPKPLFLTHKALTSALPNGFDLTSFNPLPWYHLYGLITTLQAMWKRQTAFMWNAQLPVTGEGLVKALEVARPEALYAVPYMLQLVTDADRGVDALKRCKTVVYGGAACPDELGDKLVSQGVRLGGSLGS